MSISRKVLALCLLLSACSTAVRSDASSTWADQTLASYTLRQKIGQIVFPRISGAYMPTGDVEYERVREWIVKYGIGGVIVSHGAPLEIAAKLNTMQRLSDAPLLVSADMESGPGQILNSGTILPYGLDNGGGTRFPPIMALGATGSDSLAEAVGRITALEARAVGVHVTFGPVVDVNNNPANPIINTRAYGGDAALVSRMSAAHIRGLQTHGMIATAKHFPGHGDTGTDSHVDLPIILANRERFDAVELPPYRRAIESGVAAVMTAHIAFPALTGDTIPATLNPRILTGLLREELRFSGVIFSDAMDMGAIVNIYGRTNASVMALKAGVDVLLQPYPQDIPALIDAIEQAVKSGQLSEARIDDAVRRLLRLKERLGLHRQRTVDLEKIPATVAHPEHLRVAREVAERSITVPRDAQKLLPLHGRVLSVVYTDDYSRFAGRVFHNTLRNMLPDMQTILIDANAGIEQIRQMALHLDSADVVVFAPFIGVSAGKNDLVIPAGIAGAINAMAANKPLIIASFGNPYVIMQFPTVSTYVLAWGQNDVAQRAAARAMLGQTAITGKLPIAIPPYHQFGEGLIYQAR